jgi:hypothetical protein
MENHLPGIPAPLAMQLVDLACTVPKGFNVANLRIDVAPTPRYLGT